MAVLLRMFLDSISNFAQDRVEDNVWRDLHRKVIRVCNHEIFHEVLVHDRIYDTSIYIRPERR